ncbi:uracil phosphoribosyltransferase-domain-containing protein [Mycena rosella]|uniref:Ribosomal RNA-processing protein 8 n=1 Tax=Mycena rosella TaxID=1033263 RepID=A0AAD7GNX5_MYCRO|nr:uracil phosphoribosyltransferase-domain-containing protein [Mycena rosella]
MPLFDVPGWPVATAPLTSSPVTVAGSKKRKRPADDRGSPEPIDLQKLVKKHRTDGDDASTVSRGASRVKALGKSLVQKTTDRKRQKKVDALEEKKKTISLPKALMASEKGQQMITSSSNPSLARPAKRPKRAHEPVDKRAHEPVGRPLPPIPEHSSPPAEPKATAGLTALQKGMKRSLDGARFRLINETLYKSDSQQAHEMMQKDPKVYEEYHTGFRHQVQSWPTNPVQHYISTLSKYPPKTIVVDLGCGDAAMARSLIPKGLNVLSFDLVSDGMFVVEADICDKIPLPGSEAPEGEKSDGQGQVVDVVVCALSLMGTNWTNCIREAWRILKPNGELKIAEVASRFTDVEEFSELVTSIGFKLKAKNDDNTHFTLFDFRKVTRVGKKEKEWAAVLEKGIVNILSHPIANAELSKLRRTTTTSKEFREGVNNISLILGLEASRSLEEETFTAQSPVGQFTGTVIKPRIGLTPILRAGLGMTDALLTLFPDAPIYHLGLFREKVTLQPVEYYSKLPPSPPIDMVFLLDPLIATGGTARAALSMITDWGMPIDKVKLLCVLASQEGLDHVRGEFPDLEIWVAGVDQTLTAQGLISPGLGDAGDRLFNTIRA